MGLFGVSGSGLPRGISGGSQLVGFFRGLGLLGLAIGPEDRPSSGIGTSVGILLDFAVGGGGGGSTGAGGGSMIGPLLSMCGPAGSDAVDFGAGGGGVGTTGDVGAGVAGLAAPGGPHLYSGFGPADGLGVAGVALAGGVTGFGGVAGALFDGLGLGAGLTGVAAGGVAGAGAGAAGRVAGSGSPTGSGRKSLPWPSACDRPSQSVAMTVNSAERPTIIPQTIARLLLAVLPFRCLPDLVMAADLVGRVFLRILGDLVDDRL